MYLPITNVPGSIGSNAKTLRVKHLLFPGMGVRFVIQHDISKSVLPVSLKTRPRVFNPDTREEIGAALVLSTPKFDKSVRQDWQTLREDPTHQDSLRIKRASAAAR